MPVERLDTRLDAVWQYQLALVVAPAGSGKTTLLARFAERVEGPVGWYRAEAWDADEASFPGPRRGRTGATARGHRHGLDNCCRCAKPSTPGRPARCCWSSTTYTRWKGLGRGGPRTAHRLRPAQPDRDRRTRVPPRFNLPRLRVSGALLEIGADDLRFRSWEVERLFRDYYQNPLPPEELARLARRTEGWAAGLQLFHLATRGHAPDERRRVLAALGPSSRLMRDYLTRNVLEQLPADLRSFLVETSVLGRLSAALCDQLLGRTDSERCSPTSNGAACSPGAARGRRLRYHEVLRSYLHWSPGNYYHMGLAAGDLFRRSRTRRGPGIRAAAERIT